MRGGVLFLCLFCIYLSGAGTVCAEMVGNHTIAGMHVSPIYEEVIPIDDGKEIVLVEGWGYLKVWRQVIISRISGITEGTILEWPLIMFSPVIFALLGFICILIYTSRENRKPSPPQEQIITHLKNHPGATQQQIIDAMGTSRGSVCYHLHVLERQDKIHPLSRDGRLFYYTCKNPGDLLEQTIHYLLSREKSGKFLLTLYRYPKITRKELAEHLDVTPTTVRWYLMRYTDERLCITEKCGKEYCYSLTDEAGKICEKFLEENTETKMDHGPDK